MGSFGLSEIFCDTKSIQLVRQKFSKTPNRFNWTVRNFLQPQMGSFGLYSIWIDSKLVGLDCIQFEWTPNGLIWTAFNLNGLQIGWFGLYSIWMDVKKPFKGLRPLEGLLAIISLRSLSESYRGFRDLLHLILNDRYRRIQKDLPYLLSTLV